MAAMMNSTIAIISSVNAQLLNWIDCTMTTGKRDTMLVKMISDIPLPIPRCVISSPNHMMSAVPAMSDTTITRLVNQNGGSPGPEVGSAPGTLRNSVSRPSDDIVAMPRVMYRVTCVILRCPASPSLDHCSTLGITPCRSCMMIDEVM